MLGPGRAGPRLAEAQLRAAGLSAAEVSAAVATALAERAAELGRAEPPEVALCRAAVARRVKGQDPAALDDRTRARLARWLLGRGFSGGAVARVLALADLEA